MVIFRVYAEIRVSPSQIWSPWDLSRIEEIICRVFFGGGGACEVGCEWFCGRAGLGTLDLELVPAYLAYQPWTQRLYGLP